MSITTYALLQTAVANWIARDDLTSRITEFITLFESCANRRLGTRRQETTTVLTTSSGSVALPTDFVSWRRLTYNSDSPTELEYVHPDYFYGRWGDRASGDPVGFTIIGSNLLVGPVSDSTTYTFDYFASLTALSDSATSNWLLTNYPDAYLFGSLAEAYAFIEDWEKASAWGARRDNVFDEITKLDAKARGPSRIRIDGPVV